MIEKINTAIGVFFTLLGVYFLIKGDITNGLLSMILGEAIGLPKN